MATITLELPEAVETFIKDELKTEPKTYLQNELINPIVKKYEAWLREKRLDEAKTEIDKEVSSVKSAMKIKLSGKGVK